MELGWGLSLQSRKFEFPLSVGYTPHQKIGPPNLSPNQRPYIGKKVYLTNFR